MSSQTTALATITALVLFSKTRRSFQDEAMTRTTVKGEHMRCNSLLIQKKCTSLTCVHTLP